MGFYFICYVMVGMCLGIAGTMHLAGQHELTRLSLSKFWLNPPPWAALITLACTVAPVLALIISLIQGGFWVLLTLGELVLGAIIARMLIPLSAMNGLLFLTAPALVIIFGALWGLWYI